MPAQWQQWDSGGYGDNYDSGNDGNNGGSNSGKDNRTTAATAIAGGTDYNQLKIAAEEMAAAATETAMVTEMSIRRHS